MFTEPCFCFGQFLLNKVSHGDLPVTEISRDNLRDFLDSHIGLDLKWDKVRLSCMCSTL